MAQRPPAGHLPRKRGRGPTLPRYGRAGAFRPTNPSVTIGCQKYNTASEAANVAGRCSWVVERRPQQHDGGDAPPPSAFAFGEIVGIWAQESAVFSDSIAAEQVVWCRVVWWQVERVGSYDPQTR